MTVATKRPGMLRQVLLVQMDVDGDLGPGQDVFWIDNALACVGKITLEEIAAIRSKS